MKKIIPFEKELTFKTKVSEITSISLEHTLNITNNDEVNGEFIVSGDYKMNEGSINREPFSYTIPFCIVLDNKYETDTVNLDIEDFYYEIIDSEVLKVNIEFFIEGTELIEEERDKEEPIIEVEIPKEDLIDNIVEEERDFKEEDEIVFDNNIIDTDDNIKIDINNTEEISIFNNIDSRETYVGYHVYIAKENDSLENVLTKYNITEEEFRNYNTITEIKIGDKLIIPYTKDE